MPENYITIPSEKGSVNISEAVVAVITSAAIAEVDGVAGFSNSVGSEIYDFINRKAPTKGVKVTFADGGIVVDAMVMARFGTAMATLGQKVQVAVAAAVESMTGITPKVNVHICGVSFDK